MKKRTSHRERKKNNLLSSSKALKTFIEVSTIQKFLLEVIALRCHASVFSRGPVNDTTPRSLPPLASTPQPGCQYNRDCPSNRACDRLSRRCIDPCDEDTCAPTAFCQAIDHQPRCECPAGYSGNPYIECAIREYPRRRGLPL